MRETSILRRLKSVIQTAVKIGAQMTSQFRGIIKRAAEAERRLLYGGFLRRELLFDGQKLGLIVDENIRVSRKRYIEAVEVDEETGEVSVDGESLVVHINLPKPPINDESGAFEEALRRLMKRMHKRGYELLGGREKDKYILAVFVKKGRLWDISRCIGDAVAMDSMKAVQNAVVLLCRPGHKPTRPFRVPFKHRVIKGASGNDGIIAELDRDTSLALIGCYHPILRAEMKPKTLTVTIITHEVATKGVIRLFMKENIVYQESVKFGEFPEYLDTQGIMVMNCDSLQKIRRDHQGRPITTFSTAQELPYIYAEEEDRVFEYILKPAIDKAADFKTYKDVRSSIRWLAMDMRVGEATSRKLVAKNIAAALHKPQIPGFQLIAVPGKGLERYQVRVPAGMGVAIGDKVCVTRYPVLPVGNATQIYTCVGYSDGLVVEVPNDPWVLIQGGDYDGDLARVSKYLYEVFPDKKYDDTPMSAITGKSTRPKFGGNSEKKRAEHLEDVIAMKNIGIWDILARMHQENGSLTDSYRLLFSRALQANVELEKHIVEMDFPNPKKMFPRTKRFWSCVLLRRRELSVEGKLHPTFEGTIYERGARYAWEKIQGIKLPDRVVTKDLLKGRVLQEIKPLHTELRGKVFKLAEYLREKIEEYGVEQFGPHARLIIETALIKWNAPEARTALLCAVAQKIRITDIAQLFGFDDLRAIVGVRPKVCGGVE